MSRTVPLVSDQSIYVTSFYAGETAGRVITFTAHKDGLKIVRDVPEEDLVDFICQGGLVTEDDGVRPIFDK